MGRLKWLKAEATARAPSPRLMALAGMMRCVLVKTDCLAKKFYDEGAKAVTVTGGFSRMEDTTNEQKDVSS